MPEWLSKSDWNRIQTFANSPAYARDPEMLLPDEDVEKTEVD